MAVIGDFVCRCVVTLSTMQTNIAIAQWWRALIKMPDLCKAVCTWPFGCESHRNTPKHTHMY